jgi:DNA-binding MarR family transcriptional regulator
MDDSFTIMPGHLLRRCHQIAVAIFLEGGAELDLTPLQFAVLQTLLTSGPQDQATLGGATAMDRTTTALVVSKLEQRNLLLRKRSSRDKRSRIVSITASGEKFVQRAQPMVETVQQRIVAPLSAEETAQLVELLDKLAQGNNAASRAPQRKRKRQP